MKTDITLKLTPQMTADAQVNQRNPMPGHLGTHFDVMDKEFPLDYTERRGIVFDVSGVTGRDIGIADIDPDKVREDMFVAFYSGFIEEEGYGSKRYFREHPQLSPGLIDTLLEKGISIIGIDFAGVRGGIEHSPMDRYCADRGVFIIENLCNLKSLVNAGDGLIIHTYPMNFTEMSGLPCRVVAEY